MATPHPPYDLAGWRKQIPLLRTAIPLNNCSQAPRSERTHAAAQAFLDSWNRRGMDWEGWMQEVFEAKCAFAQLINAAPDEIAVTSSVSAATASLASALDFTPSRRTVLISGAEFPAVAHVWLAAQKYGARVKWAPLTDHTIRPEAYREALDAHTLLVSACHGYYQTGCKQDVKKIAEMAHACGAYLYVDAYQTLGTCPVDVKALDIDFLSAGVLKFLMGTAGIAFLYVRRKLLPRLQPAVTGWFGRENPFAFAARTLDWAPTAARFDTGTPPVLNAYIARAGMDMINEIGPERIERWTHLLSQRLLTGGRERGLQVLGPQTTAAKAPTTAFRCENAHEVETGLRRNGVLASARGPAIRLAPHFYNTPAEIDIALDALADILQK